MQKQLILLKLILDELGIEDDISTVQNRKRVQKAIYLSQIANVDLGYRFGWYIMGPYSTNLTRDYFELSEVLSAGSKDHENMELVDNIKRNLIKVCPLLSPPKEINLAQEDWLELVASMHYLRELKSMPEEQASDVLEKEKPTLFPYRRAASEALASARLLH